MSGLREERTFGTVLATGIANLWTLEIVGAGLPRDLLPAVRRVRTIRSRGKPAPTGT